MADIPDKTANVSISDDAESKIVTITTDGSKERLDVNALVEEEDRKRLDDGDAFIINIEYNLNASQTKYQSVLTPNTAVRVYLKFKAYNALMWGDIVIYEKPTGVVYNFSWTPKDRNRETSNTSACTVRDVTSVTTPGTFLWKEGMYSTNGGVILWSKEMKLDQNTEYLFGMRNFNAGVNRTALQLQWYEF